MLYKLTFGGISFELVSIWLLFSHDSSMALMLSYLGMHALSSILFSLALSFVVPKQYRQPRLWLLGYLFAFNFFMPVVGLPCAVLAIVIGVWLPKIDKKSEYETAVAPLFVAVHDGAGAGFQGSRIRAQLNNPSMPLDERLNALAAIQDTPTRSSSGSLRQLLADPADDVRMLAYGILDGKEKKITHRIIETRQQIESVDTDWQRAALHKRVAELYQELIYQNLVQGDLLTHSCDQMREHAQQALEFNPDDQGLWFMLGRLELLAGNVSSAELAFDNAQRYGFSRERLLPYLAELSFLKKNFDRVRNLFVEITFNPSVSIASQLHRYWTAQAVAGDQDKS